MYLPSAVIAVKDGEQLLKVPLREEPDRVRQVGAVRDEGGRGGGGGLGRHIDQSSINHLINHLYHSWRILTVNYVARKSSLSYVCMNFRFFVTEDWSTFPSEVLESKKHIIVQ